MNSKIHTLPILERTNTVFTSVEHAFTEKLIEKIKKSYGTINQFNEKFFKIERHAFNWAFKNRYGHNFGRLLQICQLLDINEQELKSNIQGFYSWGSHNKPVRIPEQIEITEMFVEGYALYIAEGDTGDSGVKKSRKVRFTNTNTSVINFFSGWLKQTFLEIPVYLVIFVPEKQDYEDTRPGINISDIRIKTSKGSYNKQIKYRLCMDNAITIDILLAIRETVRSAVREDAALAAAYLRGLMAGEGTVYNNRSKYVRLEMKNEPEIQLAKELLTNLNIDFTHHKRTTRERMESIYVGGKENIRRYYELVGFGAHKGRQEKLRELVTGY